MDSNWTPGRSYRLVLRGELGDSFGFLFEGMRLQRLAGTTVLTGQVTDQAHLLGLIEQIQELGVELVSVNPDQGTNGGAGPGAEPGWSCIGFFLPFFLLIGALMPSRRLAY